MALDRISLPLPDSFPEGSSFWEVDEMLAVRSAIGFWSTLEGTAGWVTEAMSRDFGVTITEAEFRKRAACRGARSTPHADQSSDPPGG